MRFPLRRRVLTGAVLVLTLLSTACLYEACFSLRGGFLHGPDPGYVSRIACLGDARGQLVTPSILLGYRGTKTLSGALLDFRQQLRAPGALLQAVRPISFCDLNFGLATAGLDDDEYIVDTYVDYDEFGDDYLVIATNKRERWICPECGRRYDYPLPLSSRILAIFGSSRPGIGYALGNGVNGAPTAIYRLDRSKGLFDVVRTFPTGSVYDFVGYERKDGVIVVIHEGAGVSISLDGGETWTPWNTGIPLPFAADDVVFTVDGAVVVGDKGVFWNDKRDPASPWQQATGFPTGAQVGAAAANGNTVIVDVLAPTEHVLYISNDGGKTFKFLSRNVPIARVTSMKYVGDSLVLAGYDGVYSTEDGLTWRAAHTSGWSDVRGILARSDQQLGRGADVAQPATTLFATTTGNGSGVFKSTDGGRTYVPGPPSLDHAFLRAIAGSGANLVATPFSGAGLYRSSDAGGTWTKLGTPAGLPGTNVQALLASGTTFLGGVNGAPVIVRSTDSGATWKSANTGLPAVASAIYAFHETSGSLLAGSVNNLLRSTNGGDSWSALSPPAGTPPAGASPYVVVAIAGSPAALYAAVFDFSASANHGVYRSTDGGASWTRRSDGLPKASVLSLAATADGVFAGTNAGLYRSVDGGGSWQVYERRLASTAINTLSLSGDTLYAGTFRSGVWPLPARPRTERLVPIVLDVSTGTAHFTTELALTNRGTTTATVTLRYTAALGRKEGSGSVNEELPAGKQLVIGDVLAYLRGKGLALPPAASDLQQGGTLLVTFDGLSDLDAAAVTARTAAATAAPQPAGRAGLAYSGIDPLEGVLGQLAVFGLRSNTTDRSNLAVFSTGNEPVTVKVTVFSGAGEGPPKVVAEALELGPYGWTQINGILNQAGFTNGYALLQRVSATGSFSAYGVVNDQGTNDGSFLLPFVSAVLGKYVNVPVIVEAGPFESEIVLTNSGTVDLDLDLVYTESLTPAAGHGGSTTLRLLAGEQRIIPGAIQFLRDRGVAIGARGANGYAGLLHVVASTLMPSLYAAARTASRSPAAGQFGLFTPGVFPGEEGLDEAWLYGLQANEGNRSNVAVVNTSSHGDSATFELQAYDGDAGGAPKGTPVVVTLAPGQWFQSNGFLGNAGVKNGWVRVRRSAGLAGWVAYAVVNDGGAPGQRTGDGAYVPMVR